MSSFLAKLLARFPIPAKLKSRLENLFSLAFHPSPMKISLLIMATCVFAIVRHYRLPKSNGNAVDWVGVLERNLYDVRFKLRGPLAVTGEVGVLAADEQSVARFGRWPFQRTVYEKALMNLKKAGVQWIGFDSIFSEPERPYLDESVEGIQNALNESLNSKGFDADKFSDTVGNMLEASPGDRSFGKAIENFENIVQGYFFFEDTEGLKYDWLANYGKLKGSAIDFVSFENKETLADYPEIMTVGALANTDTIAGASRFQGFFNNKADPDGIIRSATLIKGIQPVGEDGKPLAPAVLIPSLGLQLASRYLKREPVVKFDQAGVKNIQLMDPNGEAEPLNIPLTLDDQGRMLINHYGPNRTFPYISLVDAYDGKFPEKLPKILIFGGVGTGFNDIRPSPYSESFDGVEHHTAVVENILSENYVARPVSSFVIEVGILILTGLFFAFVLKYTAAVTSALILVGFSVAFFMGDKYFLFGRGQWYYIGMVYLQNYSIFFGVTLFKYFTEEKEKKKIKNAFQFYLNPAVINQLMDKPDSLKLGGEKKTLTVFFSDVRGFTTISETLSPEALTSLLNEYFTPMTNIILESSGLLDKYIGDAIMAVWGAPIEMEDHPDRALRSSLLMLDALDGLRSKWKERGMPLIDIGCGINTGPMVVGNMGSDQRFDYTVLGDSVNLGARLEGITKQYGVKIICSEFTKAALKNPKAFLLRELDDIQVKGKNEPVKIFECMRSSPERTPIFTELIGQYEQALQFYRSQDWTRAEGAFMKCLQIRPDDGPSTEFLERCQYLREHSPGDNWNGVWVMKTK